MPRKSLAPAAPAGAPPAGTLPPPPPSPLVAALRRDWRWAAISQFTFTFADAFGRVDWDVDALEADFDGSETAIVPDLLAKLLVALTWNRQIKLEADESRDNALDHVRKQYAKRAAHRNVLGTEDEPVDWATLGLSQKVGIIHDLCEWQLDDPARFRSLLKSEDDAVSWRVDPLGWDKDGNAYHLFDDNRLWIQRVPPAPPAPPAPPVAARPPKKSSLKAKRAARAARRAAPKTKRESAGDDDASASGTPADDAAAAPKTPNKSHRKRQPSYTPPQPKEDEPVSGPRRRKQVELYGNPTPTAAALRRGSGAAAPPTDRSTRSARADGRDARAANGAGSTSASRSGATDKAEQPTPTRPPPLPRGTRVSRRLHSGDEEWQAVPDEWLGGSKANAANGAAGKKARDADEESELSALTDEDEHEAGLKAGKVENGNDLVKDEDLAANEEAAELDGKMPADELAKAEPADGGEAMDVDPDSPLSSAPDLLPEDIPEDPEDRSEAEYDPEAVNGKGDDDDDDDAAARRHGKKDRKRKRELDPDEIEIDETAAVVDDFEVMRQERDAFPEGFVEWETVCVTLYDWKTFPAQFAKSRDLDEKALFGMLMQVSPTIIELLEDKERERLKQEAINNRKRSSRIATRELEREEQLKREAAQRDMEERMERGRREADRAAREEAELLAREHAREARLREREERLAAREQAVVDRADAEVRAKEAAEAERAERKRRRDNGLPVEGASATPSRSVSAAAEGAAGERWELRCDVCGIHEWRTTDEDDVVACDGCGRWAHMSCHNRRDRERGRAPRDWDKIDFYCVDCRRKRSHANGHGQSPLNGAPYAPSTSSPLAHNGSLHAPGSVPSPSPVAHRQPALGPSPAHPQAHPHGPPQAYPAYPNGAPYPPPHATHAAPPPAPMRAQHGMPYPPPHAQHSAPAPHHAPLPSAHAYPHPPPRHPQDLPPPHAGPPPGYPPPPHGMAPYPPHSTGPGPYAGYPPDPRYDPRYGPLPVHPGQPYAGYPQAYRPPPPPSPQSAGSRLPPPSSPSQPQGRLPPPHPQVQPGTHGQSLPPAHAPPPPRSQHPHHAQQMPFPPPPRAQPPLSPPGPPHAAPPHAGAPRPAPAPSSAGGPPTARTDGRPGEP